MKRKLLLLSWLLCFVTAGAQQQINTSFKTQMNSTFLNMDKSRVPNGILIDYGMEFTNVPAYNGVLNNNYFTDYTKITQIYNTLLSSRIRQVNTGFVTPQVYDNNWKTNRSSEFIAIGGLYFKYAQLSDNAVANNKITVSNGLLYDKFINSVWQNPYDELQVFAMSPAIKEYTGFNVQVKIPSAIFYSNFQNLVQDIQIDFGNGQGYVPVAYNQSVPVVYTSSGVKIWKYKLNLTNGTSMYCQSRIKIIKKPYTVPYPNGNSQRSVPGNVKTEAAIPDPPPQAEILYSKTITGSPYLNEVAGVKLTIDLANGHSRIKTPLIVAEGFDLGILLSPESPNGKNTYQDFRQSISYSESLTLRNLIWSSSKQYDIIYVDWDNGVDFLQRNALALEEVIKWVNLEKAANGSTTKNVVLGQSMGGVISRYALADMEQNGMVHDTRLFISDDAPQQGANIPVGIQFLYRHLTNQYLEAGNTLLGSTVTIPIIENNYGISSYTGILDAPATRQLLSNYSNLNYGIDNSVHTAFYNELKNKGINPSVNSGYPVNCRNVAISNGSECGSTQDFNPGDYLVAFVWDKDLTFGGDLLSLVYMPLGGAVNGLLIDNDFFGVQALGSLPGHSNFNVSFTAKAIPYGSNNEIYRGTISYTKKIMWVVNKTINITDVGRPQPPGVLPLDTYGGGYYSSSAITSEVSLSGLYIRDHFDFIPTVSALDIGKRNVALTDTDYRSAYIGAFPPVAPKNSPFINFTADFNPVNPNAHNKPHLTFYTRNADWMAGELSAGTNVQLSNCSFLCNSYVIPGSDFLCAASETYAAPANMPYYSWSVTEGSNLVSLTNENTQNVTVTLNPFANGYITLQLFYGDNSPICGNRSATKRIWIGGPQTYMHNYCEFPDQTMCYLEGSITHSLPINSVVSLVLKGLGANEANFAGTHWEWEKSYGNFVFVDYPATATVMNNGTVSKGRSANIKATGSNSMISFKGRAKNDCGWGSWKYFYWNVNSSRMVETTEETTDYYKIYPNPAMDVMNIELRDVNFKPSENAEIKAALFNLNGEPKADVRIKGNIASFNVQGLPKGIYVIRIDIDGYIESHQVSIK